MAVAQALVDGARAGLSALVDMLMPPTCIGCRATVATPLGYCTECWSALPFISGARCIGCGIPLPLAWQAESHCLGCLKTPPAFDAAAAPFLYDGPARQTVLALKNGREAYAPRMAAQMLRLGPSWATPGRLVVPVPLHRWRLLARGFNQALLLAREIGQLSGATLLPDTLVRVKPTPRTRGMNHAQRYRNVEGAFRVPENRRSALRGAEVLLVDDVMTSGATASACARVLKRAGAARVDVLVYARVAAVDATPYLRATVSQDDDGQG